VLVHRVKISQINTANQQGAIKLLQEQNTKLYGNLRIARVSWPREVHRKSRKVYSSLTVYLSSPEAANQVIERGLVECGEVKGCERFILECGLVQCFKCCRYSYIAKVCHTEARCGHCTGAYETKDCKQKEIELCILCKNIYSKKNKKHKA